MFSEYSTVRALGLSDVVYIEPVATNAKQLREFVLQHHADDFRSLVDNLQTNRKPEVIDEIFKELSNVNANSNQIAQFYSVWVTDIRNLFERDILYATSADRIKRFTNDFELLLSEAKPFQCVAAVSTSSGPGAEIKYFKLLLGSNTATYFGVSKETRLIECARWTFVSYRTKES